MSVTVRDLMTDPALFGDQFSGDSWAPWRALLCGFFGLALTDDELEHWRNLTRLDAPLSAFAELWLVIGRRGGKSQAAALLAVFYACFIDYQSRLSPGEVATVAVLAADRKQARSVFRYISGLMNSNPMLRRLIIAEDKESITLANSVAIEVTTASFRGTRGYTFAAVIADEIAFWRSDESANPDTEILNALRPGLATLGGPLICLSSPYSKRGELWNNYKRHYAKPSEVLVAQAPTLTMNPSLPKKIIDAAFARDPVAAAAEYGAQFRNDIAAFISRDLVDNCARRSPMILPKQSGKRYAAFIDVAGGGADEYTMSIAHKENGRVIVDGVWAEKGDPAEITALFAQVMKTYGITRCTGDRYAAEWPRAEYRKHGITMDNCKLNRSELYLELMPLLQTGAIELSPDEKAINQFTQLERRTGRIGKDTIDHGPQGHDDRCNAIAGAAYLMQGKRYDLNLIVNGQTDTIHSIKNPSIHFQPVQGVL